MDAAKLERRLNATSPVVVNMNTLWSGLAVLWDVANHAETKQNHWPVCTPYCGRYSAGVGTDINIY